MTCVRSFEDFFLICASLASSIFYCSSRYLASIESLTWFRESCEITLFLLCVDVEVTVPERIFEAVDPVTEENLPPAANAFLLSLISKKSAVASS